MPMKSQAQRAYLHIHHPEIAAEWEKHTPKGKKLPQHVGSTPEKKAALTALLALCVPSHLKTGSQQQATPQVPSGPPNAAYPNGTMTETQLSNVSKAYQKTKAPPKPPPTMASWAPGGKQQEKVLPPPTTKTAVQRLVALCGDYDGSIKQAETAEQYSKALSEFTDKVQEYMHGEPKQASEQYSSVLDYNTALSGEYNTELYCKDAGELAITAQAPIVTAVEKTAVVPAGQPVQPNAQPVPNAAQPVAAANQHMDTASAAQAMQGFVPPPAAPIQPGAAAQAPLPGGANVIARNGLGGPNASLGGPSGTMTGMPGAKTAAMQRGFAQGLEAALRKRAGVPSGRENCAGCGASMEKSDDGGYCNSCGCDYETGKVPAKGLYHEGQSKTAFHPYWGFDWRTVVREAATKAAVDNYQSETPALDFLYKRAETSMLAEDYKMAPSPKPPSELGQPYKMAPSAPPTAQPAAPLPGQPGNTMTTMPAAPPAAAPKMQHSEDAAGIPLPLTTQEKEMRAAPAVPPPVTAPVKGPAVQAGGAVGAAGAAGAGAAGPAPGMPGNTMQSMPADKPAAPAGGGLLGGMSSVGSSIGNSMGSAMKGVGSAVGGMMKGSSTPALDFLKAAKANRDRLAKLRARRPSPGDPKHEW